MILDSLFGGFEELNGNLSEPISDIEPSKLPEIDYKKIKQNTGSTDISLPKIDKNKSLNGRKAVDYLVTKHGLPRHVAAAAVGNAMQESNLDPNAINKQSGAYGLFQWLGNRKSGYIKKYGNNPTFENQLDYMVEELNTTESKAKKNLYNTKDPLQASRVFADDFERMGKHEANYPRRNANTMSVFKMGGCIPKGKRPKYALGADMIMQLGSSLNNLIGESIDSLDNDKPYSNKWVSAASGYAKGNAQLPGIGGIIGGISGFVQANKEKEKWEQAERDKQKQYMDSAKIRSIMTAPNTNKNIQSFYDKGGEINADYEVEKGEIITGSPNLTNGSQISNSIHKVTGYTHDEINPKTGTTGVLGTGGDRVYSNSIYNGDKTIAQQAEQIGKKIAKEEKKMKTKIGIIGRQTAMLNKIKLDNMMDELFNTQESIKEQYSDENQYKYGGELPKYKSGGELTADEAYEQAYKNLEKTAKARAAKANNAAAKKAADLAYEEAYKVERSLAKKVGKNVVDKVVTKLGSAARIAGSLGRAGTVIGLATDLSGDVSPTQSKPKEQPITPEQKATLEKQGFSFQKPQYQTGQYKPVDVNGRNIFTGEQQKPTNITYVENNQGRNSPIPGTLPEVVVRAKKTIPQRNNIPKKELQAGNAQSIIDNTILPIIRNEKPIPTIGNVSKIEREIPRLQIPIKKQEVSPNAVVKPTETVKKSFNLGDIDSDIASLGITSLGNLANYIGVNNRLNKIKTNSPVNLISAANYGYADRSGLNRSMLNQSLRNINSQPYMSPQAKQNAYATYVKGLNEVENNERNTKLDYDNQYAQRQWQIDAQNKTMLTDSQRQRIANENLVNSEKINNFNNLYQNTNTALGEYATRNMDKKKLSILSKAYKYKGADVLKEIQGILN